MGADMIKMEADVVKWRKLLRLSSSAPSRSQTHPNLPQGKEQVTLIRVLFQTSVHRRRLMDTKHSQIYLSLFLIPVSLFLFSHNLLSSVQSNLDVAADVLFADRFVETCLAEGGVYMRVHT